MDPFSPIHSLPAAILGEFDRVWTWFLLVIRYSALFLVVPGLGGGAMGLPLRMPAIIVLAFTSLLSSPLASAPNDLWGLAAAAASEIAVGAILGVVPYLIVAGAQGAGFLASTSMGLNAGQFFDPSLGSQSTEISKIYGDLFIFLMFSTNAHHLIIYGASGSSGYLVPGTFLVSASTLSALINQSADIFTMAFMVASPVIAALFLLQVLLGMLSKAVPTINVFIVSFPITVAVGLLITLVSLPTVGSYLAGRVTSMEGMYRALMP